MTPLFTEHSDIAVLIPCLNEAAAIGKVVKDFRSALPHAIVFVYDNGSTDRTVEIARAAGALVRREPLPGKGNVVRRMFADIDADVYILVDGDDTYDASVAPELVQLLLDGSMDMVNGARRPAAQEAFRAGHVLGNKLLTGLVAGLFGNRVTDLLSGYRVLSRRFVKSFPAVAAGFEFETELSVHALQLRMPVGEVLTRYRQRPRGSVSKLHTYRDGLRILKTIVMLVKEEKPLAFFSSFALLFAVTALGLGVPVVINYVHTGLVPRLPTAILAASIALLSFMSLQCGLILSTVSRGRAETKRLAYLSVAPRITAARIPEAGRRAG